MFSDALLTFVPTQTPLSLVGVPSARSMLYDFAGVGAGVAPPNIWGQGSGAALFGQPDAMGVGSFRPELSIATGAAAFVGAGVTLNIQLQIAADAGTPTYQPSVWTTISESGPIPVASLAKQTKLWPQPWIPAWLVTRPRFISLNFVMAGGQFTTGSIGYAWVTMGRDDLTNAQVPRNYSV